MCDFFFFFLKAYFSKCHWKQFAIKTLGFLETFFAACNLLGLVEPPYLSHLLPCFEWTYNLFSYENSDEWMR